MSLFQRRVNYDRKKLLTEAERARAKGRRRRAIGLYRRVLAVEPRNLQINARLAPLLAQTGQDFDAWQSFKRVAAGHMSNNQTGEALAVYRQAARYLPRQIEAWQGLAQLERRHGRNGKAREALLKGRRAFRSRRDRPKAIALLRAAREIDPWDAEIVLDLARLLTRSRQAPEAQWLLEELVKRCSGRQLKQARGLQWRIEPSLLNTWHWLRAVISVRRSSEDAVPA